MVKAYLRYVRQDAFGVVAAPSGNVSFFTCPPSVLPAVPAAEALPSSTPWSAAAAEDVTAGQQGQRQYALTCSGPAVLLWHFSQQKPLLFFTPLPPPAAAASAAAAATTSCTYHATRLAVSKGNRYLVVGYSDGSVRLWECPTAAALDEASSAASAAAAACARDSPAAAAAAAALYPAPVLTLNGHRSAVTSLAWGSDAGDALVGDTHLLSGAGDGDVIVWDRLLGAGVCRLRAHSAPVTALLLLSHCPAAAAAAAAATDTKPDAAEDVERAVAVRAAVAAGEIRGHGRRGLLLISGGKDGVVKIWDADLQLCLQTIVDAAAAAVSGAHGLATAGGGRAEVWSLAIDKAQTRLLVGCADHVIRVYKLHRGGPRRFASSQEAAAEGSAAAPGEGTAAAADTEEEKEEEAAAAAETAAAAAATAASMGVSVDFVMGLPLFASFFGALQRQAGGGSSSKRRTRCMQFVDLSGGAAAAEEGVPMERDADSLLIVCSGASRSVEVYRVCGPREMRRRMRRRRKRQLEKLKKKDKQLLEEKAAGKEEDQVESVTDQFVFLYRLHTTSLVKSFDARPRCLGGNGAHAAAADRSAASAAAAGKRKRHKADKRRQQQQQRHEDHEQHAGPHQDTARRLNEVDMLLGLADNAIELWRIETEQLSEALSRPFSLKGGSLRIDVDSSTCEYGLRQQNMWLKTSSTVLGKKGAAAGAEAHPEKQHQQNDKDAAAAPAHLVRRLAAAGHRGTIRHLTISHDSSLLLSLADEGLKIWTVHSRRCVKTLALDVPQCGFFLAGNEHLLVGTCGGELLLVDVAACEVQQQQDAHGGPVQALAEHPKHTSFASISSDKTVKFFVLYVESAAPTASPDNSSLPSTNSAAAASTRKQKKRLRDKGSHLEVASAADCSVTAPDAAETPKERAGATAATGGGCIRFRQVGSIELPDAGVAAQYTMNGKYIACALQDMTVLLFYADSNKLFLSLYGHQLPIYSISISSDSTLLATGSGDKTVKIWNVDFGNIQQSLLAHEQAVTQVLFLFQTHYLLSASLDALVKLWDVDKRHCLVTIFSTVGNSAITCLAATGDGDMIFAADASRLMQCWRRSQEQLFVEEEQQRRWEEAADRQALREDALVGTTAASTHVVFERTTKRTMEALRSTERLMEVLDEAREQQELDAAHARSLKAWEEQRRKSSSTVEVPRPMPPPPKPELMGRTAADHVLRMLTGLRSSDALEVLVALPFDYARRLLAFIVVHLSTYDALSTAAHRQQQVERRRVLEAAAVADASQRRGVIEEGQPDAEEQTDAVEPADNLQIFLCPVETAARVAIMVVQLHFKVFLASPSLRPLLASLRSCLRPLLLQERDRLRFNSAACAFFERHLEQERVSLKLSGHNDSVSSRRTRG